MSVDSGQFGLLQLRNCERDGKSIYLGVYGTPESDRRYAEMIDGLKPKPKPDPVESALLSMPVPGERLTVGRLTLAYFNRHVLTYYRKNGEPTSEVRVIQSATQAVGQTVC